MPNDDDTERDRVPKAPKTHLASIESSGFILIPADTFGTITLGATVVGLCPISLQVNCASAESHLPYDS